MIALQSCNIQQLTIVQASIAHDETPSNAASPEPLSELMTPNKDEDWAENS